MNLWETFAGFRGSVCHRVQNAEWSLVEVAALFHNRRGLLRVVISDVLQFLLLSSQMESGPAWKHRFVLYISDSDPFVLTETSNYETS